jgi:hypothetical protein
MDAAGTPALDIGLSAQRILQTQFLRILFWAWIDSFRFLDRTDDMLLLLAKEKYRYLFTKNTYTNAEMGFYIWIESTFHNQLQAW